MTEETTGTVSKADELRKRLVEVVLEWEIYFGGICLASRHFFSRM
jgi:hypothetical protein